MYELHKRISDKIARDNANYKLQADIGKNLKLLMLVMLNSCMHVVLDLLKC